MMVKHKKQKETKETNKRIKPLLPSLREKKRFLVFQVDSEEEFRIEEINKAITEKFKELFGVFGLGEAGLLMLNNKYLKKEKKGIIKVNNKNVDRLKTTFTFIDKINNKDASIRSVGLSGILRKAEKKFM